ncbi:MAG: tRNA uridine-5-carboxymethylaminomethyl(34) synthesis GTPase MnmE [Rhizobiaceae bacterium]|nr:tRNA uridine-5-carboxymethylaminomethyl(34) synthesis GTPase MnmE [Rhizobiaceae bacterium]
MTDTIFALSSGGLPSGVAVIRISGPQSRVVIETMCNDTRFGEAIRLSSIVDPVSRMDIDRGIVLSFIAPASFTGEDVVELHIHGGRAVVEKILKSLSILDGFRHADAGEFTYRAFENGKLDLTQAEGIADLIESETETQRILALDSAAGKAREIVENWSDRLTAIRALVEAEIDFVDEDDIADNISGGVWVEVKQLIKELNGYLENVHAGEIIRNGFRVTLLGKPNSGKSTLLNCLAGRDVAIVSDEPGTTRDILEVKLNLGGQVVIVSDTAGIHETSNTVEKEGIKRARNLADISDMNIWLHSADDEIFDITAIKDNHLVVLSKSDKIGTSNELHPLPNDVSISVFGDSGIDRLVGLISEAAKDATSHSGDILFSKERQQAGLIRARDALGDASNKNELPLEIRAEHLRTAGNSFGRIVGKVDVEDILGEIFAKFCVGK